MPFVRLFMRNIQTAVSPDPLKIDTCLYELIYSEYSILPPPKIFTIPPETPCIYTRYPPLLSLHLAYASQYITTIILLY
jgi:hypothetical protein